MLSNCAIRSCEEETVNGARQSLFTPGKVQAALYEHILGAILQASYFWVQSLIKIQTIPTFDEMGWLNDDKRKIWLPFWTKLADVSQACSMIRYCGCKKGCQLGSNCGCRVVGFRCTNSVLLQRSLLQQLR